MRTPLLAANWKMHKTLQEAASLARSLKERFSRLNGREVVLCPPFTSLVVMAEILKGGRMGLGGQDCHWENQGAFTGAVSPAQLKDAGCTHAIVGHSERRHYFGETDATVNLKAKAALVSGLIPIVCVGETLQEREKGETFKVIERQMTQGLSGISKEKASQMVVAYEPVWAIGTGKTAAPSQAEEVHVFIRGLLAKLISSEASAAIRILYGGSIKPDNIDELMKQPDIDGGLVGGASLELESFARIVNFRS